MRRAAEKGIAILLCTAAIMGAGSVCRAGEMTEQPDTMAADEIGRGDLDFSFADVANVEFWFSSGAGAWATMLRIYEDGSFQGEYHDSDMGDIGEGYPGGTVYLSDFTGRFTELAKVDDYTYSFQLESIELAQEPDTDEIKDEVRYIYSVPYGFDDGKDFLLYLPGAFLQELPESFRSWVGYYDLSGISDTELAFYGLYNVQGGYGFSGYEIAEEETLDEELLAIEAEAEVLQNKLHRASGTQEELNETAADLYRLWDDKLNAVWSNLKAALDEEQMNQLVEEELAWISYKESEMEAAGASFEEGSIREMVRYTRGAELTRERTYELVELLK